MKSSEVLGYFDGSYSYTSIDTNINVMGRHFLCWKVVHSRLWYLFLAALWTLRGLVTESKMCAWLHIIKVNFYQGSPCFCCGLTIMTYIKKSPVGLSGVFLLDVWIVYFRCLSVSLYIVFWSSGWIFRNTIKLVLFTIRLSQTSFCFMVWKHSLTLKDE